MAQGGLQFSMRSADVPKEDDVLIEKDEILDEKSLFCASVRGRFLIAVSLSCARSSHYLARPHGQTSDSQNFQGREILEEEVARM
jgi:hypothetical protein